MPPPRLNKWKRGHRRPSTRSNLGLAHQRHSSHGSDTETSSRKAPTGFVASVEKKTLRRNARNSPYCRGVRLRDSVLTRHTPTGSSSAGHGALRSPPLLTQLLLATAELPDSSHPIPSLHTRCRPPQARARAKRRRSPFLG